MEITKEEYERILELSPNFFGLELKQWYRGAFGQAGVLIYFDSTDHIGRIKGYGINSQGWYDSRKTGSHYGSILVADDWIRATEEEVLEALIKEAKRRGFKFGCSWGRMTAHRGERYRLEDNILSLQSGFIMEDGRWLEINKDLIKGKWYMYPWFGDKFIFLYNGDSDSFQVGLDSCGSLCKDLKIRPSEFNDYVEATEQDLFDRL
jgi:hypothetical protein